MIKASGWMALAACVLGAPAAARAEQGPFVYVEDVTPSTLNPAYSATMVETRLDELMFNGLFTDDRLLNPADDLALKDKSSVSDDHRSMKVTLADRKWDDGEPVTADDVAFTITALKDPKSDANERSTVAFIKDVKVVSPKELEFTFERPVRDPFKRMMFKILPKHKFPKAPPLVAKDEFRTHPVGTGRFKFGSWKDIQIQMTATNPTPSAVSAIQTKFVSDKSAQLSLIQYDSIHAIVRVDPKDRPVMKGLSERVDLIPYDSLTWWYIGVNHRNKDLAQVNVRRAVAHALDRDELLKAHLGDGQTISGPFAPRSQFYNNNVKPYPADPAMVEKLMKEAGYTLDDGTWSKDKKKVKLEMVLDKAMDVHKDVCLDMQSRLKKAGFDVDIEWLDTAAWEQKVIKEHKFDLTVSIWTFDEASNIFDLFYSSGNKNYFGYANQEIDGLLKQSKETADPEVFLQIYLRVHELAHQDLPYVFLWSVDSYSAISNKLTGVVIHPFRYFTWVGEWRWREAEAAAAAK